MYFDSGNKNTIQTNKEQLLICPSQLFKLMPEEEQKLLILEAGKRAAAECRLFSMNDIYRNIELPGFRFECKAHNKTWIERTKLISLGLIRQTLKENGFATLERKGGINVARWYKIQHCSVIIDADQHQEVMLQKMINENAAAARSQTAIIEV